MRLEFIPKHQAKILAIEPLSEKRGQTDMVPAVAVTLRYSLPTEKIAMLDKSLHAFLFKEGNPAQGQLEKTLVLTDAAKAIGSFGWDGEQTGTGLNVYFGISGDMNFKLTDGTVNKAKVSPKDGGWDLELRYYSAKNIDEEVIGGLGVLKNHDVDTELVPPEIVDKKPDLVSSQKRLDETPDADPLTPEAALAKEVKKDATAAKVADKVTPIKPTSRRQSPREAAEAFLGHDKLQ